MEIPEGDKGPKNRESNFFRDNILVFIFVGFMLFVFVRCSQLQTEYDSPAAQMKREQKIRDAAALGRALDRVEGRYAPEP